MKNVTLLWLPKPQSLTRYWLLVFAVVFTALMAGCGPAPLGVSWAGVSTLGDQQSIVLAMTDRIIMVDPADGQPIELKDSNGRTRVDDNGNPLTWQVTGPENSQAQFYASPISLNENSLLLAAYNSKIYEVDIDAARIENPSGVSVPHHVIGSMLLDGDRVYIPMSEQNLIAMDINGSDLTEAWTFTTGRGIWSSPLLADGILYFTSLDHFLYAVDAESGEQIWRTDLQGAATATPVEQNGHLYVGSFAGKFFDISAESGEILNQIETTNWVWSAPALVDDTLYVGDLGGYVYALDVSDGMREMWRAQVSPKGIRPTPIVTDSNVIVGSRDHKVYWLNRADGSTNFSRELQTEILSDMLLIQPTEANGLTEPLLIISTMSSQELLVAFTLEQGERRWTYKQ